AKSVAVCSLVGKLVSVDDCMAERPALGMKDGDVLNTGKYRFSFLHTPHVPHCWEAGFLFEETQHTLLCSDLFHQNGDVEPATHSDVLGRCRQVLVEYQQGPLANYVPYTSHTEPTLHRLAELQPKTLATMHGSTFVGDGARALHDLATIFKDVLVPKYFENRKVSQAMLYPFTSRLQGKIRAPQKAMQENMICAVTIFVVCTAAWLIGCAGSQPVDPNPTGKALLGKSNQELVACAGNPLE